jgi:lambda repressor-like predicted transcriptional regulator
MLGFTVQRKKTKKKRKRRPAVRRTYARIPLASGHWKKRQCEDAVAGWDMAGFRDNLRAYIKNQGISRRELARRAGINDTTLANIMTDPTRVHLYTTTAAALAYAADLSLDFYVVVN